MSWRDNSPISVPKKLVPSPRVRETRPCCADRIKHDGASEHLLAVVREPILDQLRVSVRRDKVVAIKKCHELAASSRDAKVPYRRQAPVRG